MSISLKSSHENCVVARRIRAAALAVPLAAAIFLVSIPLRGESKIHPLRDPAGFATRVTAVRFRVGFLGNAIGLALLLVGVWALHQHFSHRAPRRALPDVAGVLAATGIALVMPFFGIAGVGYPSAAHVYLRTGDEAAVSTAAAMFEEGPLRSYLVVCGSVYLLGFVLFAFLAWRTRLIPRLLAPVLIVAIGLLVSPPTIEFEVAGAAALLIVGCAFVRCLPAPSGRDPDLESSSARRPGGRA